MTTASQRGAANRRKGHVAERDLCRWLRAHGFPGAERAVRTGFRTAGRASADPGDVTGTPGIVWSVKDCAVEQTAQWLAEADAMLTAAGADVALLVHKRRGHADPARWWCWLPLGMVVWIAHGGARPPEWLAPSERSYPVRMELGHVVPLLHAAGYGSAAEGVA